jgi:hypothetical protein
MNIKSKKILLVSILIAFVSLMIQAGYTFAAGSIPPQKITVTLKNQHVKEIVPEGKRAMFPNDKFKLRWMTIGGQRFSSPVIEIGENIALTLANCGRVWVELYLGTGRPRPTVDGTVVRVDQGLHLSYAGIRYVCNEHGCTKQITRRHGGEE